MIVISSHMESEKTYDFSVEIPIVDEDTGEYTREIELVSWDK